MRKKLILIVLLMILSLTAGAQFKDTGGTIAAGPPGSDTTGLAIKNSDVAADSIGGFSIRRMFRGLAHKDTLTPTYLIISSAIMPGSAQIYNKDYWKLPIVYGGIGGGIFLGIQSNKKYKDTGEKKYATYRNLAYAAAGSIYWGSMLDGVINFKSSRTPDPGKAALYSALLPGLGQAYNGDWWHIPIYYGGLLVCGYTYHLNNIEYKRFKYIYDMANDKDSGYVGNITSTQAEWYKSLYRKYRDYSVVATILVYVLNIIDANVFAYMSDFNVSDDLSMSVQPAVIDPISIHLAQANAPSAFGFQMQLKF